MGDVLVKSRTDAEAEKRADAAASFEEKEDPRGLPKPLSMMALPRFKRTYTNKRGNQQEGDLETLVIMREKNKTGRDINDELNEAMNTGDKAKQASIKNEIDELVYAELDDNERQQVEDVMENNKRYEQHIANTQNVLEETSQTNTGIPEGIKPSERSIEDATDEDRTKTPPPKEPSKTPIGVSGVRGSKRGTLERLQSPDIDERGQTFAESAADFSSPSTTRTKVGVQDTGGKDLDEINRLIGVQDKTKRQNLERELERAKVGISPRGPMRAGEEQPIRTVEEIQSDLDQMNDPRGRLVRVQEALAGKGGPTRLGQARADAEVSADESERTSALRRIGAGRKEIDDYRRMLPPEMSNRLSDEDIEAMVGRLVEAEASRPTPVDRAQKRLDDINSKLGPYVMDQDPFFEEEERIRREASNALQDTVDEGNPKNSQKYRAIEQEYNNKLEQHVLQNGIQGQRPPSGISIRGDSNRGISRDIGQPIPLSDLISHNVRNDFSRSAKVAQREGFNFENDEEFVNQMQQLGISPNDRDFPNLLADGRDMTSARRRQIIALKRQKGELTGESWLPSLESEEDEDEVSAEERPELTPEQKQQVAEIDRQIAELSGVGVMGRQREGARYGKRVGQSSLGRRGAKRRGDASSYVDAGPQLDEAIEKLVDESLTKYLTNHFSDTDLPPDELERRREQLSSFSMTNAPIRIAPPEFWHPERTQLLQDREAAMADLRRAQVMANAETGGREFGEAQRASEVLDREAQSEAMKYILNQPEYEGMNQQLEGMNQQLESMDQDSEQAESLRNEINSFSRQIDDKHLNAAKKALMAMVGDYMNQGTDALGYNIGVSEAMDFAKNNLTDEIVDTYRYAKLGSALTEDKARMMYRDNLSAALQNRPQSTDDTEFDKYAPVSPSIYPRGPITSGDRSTFQEKQHEFTSSPEDLERLRSNRELRQQAERRTARGAGRANAGINQYRELLGLPPVEQPEEEQPEEEQPEELTEEQMREMYEQMQPQAEQPQAEQPQAEQPQAEQPQVEQPQVEQPQGGFVEQQPAPFQFGTEQTPLSQADLDRMNQEKIPASSLQQEQPLTEEQLRQMYEQMDLNKGNILNFDTTRGDELLKGIKDKFWQQGY